MADYTQIVRDERSKFGTPLGVENAWKVCNAVALRLQRETGDAGWGLHRKGGNNFRGYATDIVAHRSGRLFDILGDSEGRGVPQWSEVAGTLDWAPPEGATDPGPTPNPEPGGGDAVAAELRAIKALVQRIADKIDA